MVLWWWTDLLLAALLRALLGMPQKVARPVTTGHTWTTGDVVLFRTTDLLFKFSSCIMQGEFSHVGVVLAPPHVPEPMLLESLNGGHHALRDTWTGCLKDGPQLHPLMRRLCEYQARRGGYQVVRRLRGPPLPANTTDRIRTFCIQAAPHFPTCHDVLMSAGMAQLRDTYSPYILPLPLPQTVPPHTICCSGIVAQFFLMCGVMRPTVPCAFVFPRMFADNEATHRVHDDLGLHEHYRFSPGQELLLPQ